MRGPLGTGAHRLLSGRRLVHLTTTDQSLALLLGPQLRAFSRAGLEVIGASAPGPWVDSIEAAGIRHVPVEHATRAMEPGQDALALLELVRLFRRLRPDIVHTHNPKPGLYGRVAARLARVPVVVNTVHGLYATRADSWRLRLAVYGLERTAAAFSDAELIQNPEDLVTLRRLGVPAGKLVLLGNGVDLERFRPASSEARHRARREFPFPVAPGTVVVGVVARLVRQKGLREVLDAARQLRRTHPMLEFVIVGGVEDASRGGLTAVDLEAAARLGNVRILGERRDIDVVYRAFDLLVLASYREGIPRAVMEASACGLPVVASDVRGCRQAVRPGVSGLLVPARDSGALAEAIAALADDPQRRARMGRAGRVWAESQFDERTVVETTLDTYARLIGRDHSPAVEAATTHSSATAVGPSDTSPTGDASPGAASAATEALASAAE